MSEQPRPPSPARIAEIRAELRAWIAKREYISIIGRDVLALLDQVEALTADVARLRARTHELQERHDKDTAGLRKRVAWFEDLWRRAGEALTYEVEQGWHRSPSAWERATWSTLVAERDTARAWSARWKRVAQGAAAGVRSFHEAPQPGERCPDH